MVAAIANAPSNARATTCVSTLNACMVHLIAYPTWSARRARATPFLPGRPRVESPDVPAQRLLLLDRTRIGFGQAHGPCDRTRAPARVDARSRMRSASRVAI